LLTGWSGSGIWEGVTTEECRRRACTDGGAGSRARRSAPRSAARREGARGRRAVVFINGDARRQSRRAGNAPRGRRLCSPPVTRRWCRAIATCFGTRGGGGREGTLDSTNRGPDWWLDREGRCVAMKRAGALRRRDWYSHTTGARDAATQGPSSRTSRPSRAYGWTLLTGWSGSGIWEGVTTEECRRRACTDGGAGSRARRSAPRSAARREGARGRRAVVFINGDTRRHVTERRPVIVTRRRRRQRRREQRERARSTRAGSQCDLCGSESTDRRLTGKSMSATLASGDQGASRRMRAGESAAAAGTAATCGDHGRPLWRQRTT